MKSEQKKTVKDEVIDGGTGVVKSVVASGVPVLGWLIAGWDGYRRGQHDRYVTRFLAELQDRVGDLEAFFTDEWVRSEEGTRFVRKIVACAVDGQLEDKHQLFANALVNGIGNKDIPTLQKLQFVDMLRRLSRAALDTLAQIHAMCEPKIYRPGRQRHSMSAAPSISRQLVRQLAEENSLEPYLIEASINEMKSMGLFSQVGSWRRDSQGRVAESSVFPEGSGAMHYTHFSAQFAEFIERKDWKNA